MDSSHKHQFLAGNRLTVNQGALEATIIPARNQPDWVVPTVLILAELDCDTHLTSYKWQQQMVKVYALVPVDDTPDSLIILEGSRDENRVGLLIKGQLTSQKIKISDIKDITFEADTIHDLEFLYQGVTVNDQPLVIPDLEALANHLNR